MERVLKFYIAAHVSEKDRVRSLQGRLKDLGHEITADWTADQGIWGKDRGQHPKRVEAIAARDLEGVRACDVFILLAEPPAGRAKYAELGAAIMLASLTGGPRVYVLGEETHHSMFFYHPLVKRVRSLEETQAHLAT